MTDESRRNLAGLMQNLCSLTVQYLWKSTSESPGEFRDSKSKLSKHDRFVDQNAAALRQMRQRTTVTQHMYASRPWHADHENADDQVRDACAH